MIDKKDPKGREQDTMSSLLGRRAIVVEGRKVTFSTKASKITSHSATTEPTTTVTPIHVHPASKTVLRHLQGCWSEWTQSRGLDYGLKINNDGTFRINNFPDSGYKIWTTHDYTKQQHWLNVDAIDMMSRYKVSDTPLLPVRPWTESTNYEKKLRKRSILKLYDKERIPEHEVTTKVDEMIHRLTRWGK